LFSFLPSGI